MTQYKQDTNESQVNNFTLSDEVKGHLKEAKRITVLTGAGISTESGPGTFRGKSSIWGKTSPHELASMAGFMSNPELVWEWYCYRRTVFASAKPNAAHLALTDWERIADSFCLITQNVDGLHSIAGQRYV